MFTRIILLLSLCAAMVAAQTVVSIALPERTRLLDDQRVDLVVEVRNFAGGTLRVLANGQDISRQFSGPANTALDCDSTADAVFRADMMSFPAGDVRIEAWLETPAGRLGAAKDLVVQPFRLPEKRRNVIVFIGDGMTEEWRTAGRIVTGSMEPVPGVPGLREGFYDRLLEMDRMPVAGMVITHGLDKVIPDSANSASALTTGNKTFDGAFGVFPDGTDCAWMPGANAANRPTFLDNPRVETLPEYLKRKFNYRIGVVTTSAVSDATSAAQASHMGERDASFDVVSQFHSNPFLGGQVAVDVWMGGGKESFDPDIRADGRDMVAEFEKLGFKVVLDASELANVTASDGRVLGLFRRATTVSTHSSRIRPSSTGHMNVAYDKLGLTRPGSEPLPEWGNWKNQPFLDAMTKKAIDVLGGPDGTQPFYLMVEGASIDKQSHSGHAAGALWDVIEFDKAVGVGRAWAAARKAEDTLMIVTADHGQPMQVIGTAELSDADLYDRTSTHTLTIAAPTGTLNQRVYKDAPANTRMQLPYASFGGVTGAPAEKMQDVYGRMGFPDYIDSDGDGYPENREVDGKGRIRLALGFRTGSHTGATLPLSAEGPGAFLFTGVMDQTEVPLKIAAALGGDTSVLDNAMKALLFTGGYPKTYGK
ncbi:MAG: alkaline phosphatase [Candidatus Solibacter usitatus]|nr:alkaline phosphatase [Candidatus Solibacter usitatus]